MISIAKDRERGIAGEKRGKEKDKYLQRKREIKEIQIEIDIARERMGKERDKV